MSEGNIVLFTPSDSFKLVYKLRFLYNTHEEFMKSDVLL